MLKRVNHIGIAVKDMEEAREYWNKMFGVETHHRLLPKGTCRFV